MSLQTRSGADHDSVALNTLDLSRALRPLDSAHILMLAEVWAAWPPILVARGSLLLVDGYMRVAAAQRIGVTRLPVIWIDGDDAELLVRAVAANILHGLPLTMARRKEAAGQLFELYPEWASRRIAVCCGLSEATVRRMPRPGASTTQPDARRIGRDGKTYPLTNERQDHARRMLVEDRGRSDRDIARAAGVSPDTVGALRRRLTAGPVVQPPRGWRIRLYAAWRAFARLLRRHG